MATIAVDGELLTQAVVLRDRAASLRSQADQLVEILADTYRRRASELEFEAFLVELSAGLPDDAVHAPAA